MKLVYIYADYEKEMNCSKWNCFYPASAVNRTGVHQATIIHVDQFIKNTPEVQNICQSADIIIVERNFFGDCLTILQYWKVRNKTIITIFDDGYDVMLKDNPAYDFWHLNHVKVRPDTITHRIIKEMNEQKQNNGLWNNADMQIRDNLIGSVSSLLSPIVPDVENVATSEIPFLTQFKWGIQIGKGIQVPSKQLAKDWEKYNKTYYVRNYLDINKYMNVAPLHPHDNIVIGWCGSLSHRSSFTNSGIVSALKIVVNKHKNVSLLIGGDKYIFDLLDVPNDRKFFQPYVPENQWAQLLRSIDIGLAPLCTIYDKRRSWIKVLEYMALQMPWVASNFPAYEELKQYGTITENGSENWENTLSNMIENFDKEKQRATGDGYKFALSQSTDNNILKTIELYKSIIGQPYK
jgi:glycosyltransferase involved in cell wall biosynthesis